MESGNVKLGQVAADALGVSGLQMLRALAAGETNPDMMSRMARGRLKRKQKELKRALSGQLTEARRWVLSQLLDQYDRVKVQARKCFERLSLSSNPKQTLDERRLQGGVYQSTRRASRTPCNSSPSPSRTAKRACWRSPKASRARRLRGSSRACHSARATPPRWSSEAP